jgi:hypothetical protein
MPRKQAAIGGAPPSPRSVVTSAGMPGAGYGGSAAGSISWSGGPASLLYWCSQKKYGEPCKGRLTTEKIADRPFPEVEARDLAAKAVNTANLRGEPTVFLRHVRLEYRTSDNISGN